MVELSLDDYLTDPITRQLMARDGVAEQDLRDLATQLQADVEARREPKSFED